MSTDGSKFQTDDTYSASCYTIDKLNLTLNEEKSNMCFQRRHFGGGGGGGGGFFF